MIIDFYLILLAAFIVPAAFVLHFWSKAKKEDMFYMDRDSREMYVDSAKTLITIAGIGVPVLVSALNKREEMKPLVFMVQFAVLFLMLSLLASIGVVLALRRGYELARSRGKGEEVALSRAELIWILMLAYVALSTFLAGFVCIGKYVFSL